MNSLAGKLTKTFNNVKQAAVEKFGRGEELTVLPKEYTDLETSIERVKVVYENLVRVFKQFTVQANQYHPPIADNVRDVVGKMTTSRSGETSPTATPAISQSPEIVGRNLSQVMSKATMDAADLFADQSELLALGFRNFSLALDKCASSREILESAIQKSLIDSLTKVLETDLGAAQKAGKALHQSRLELDSVKSRLRNAKSDKIEKLSEELREAEQHFTFSLETAILRMKSVMDNKDLIKHVNAVIQALVSYHKSCFDALNALVI